ncbi:MAG TPA: hypothetical protein VGM81_13230 [Burkholderiaceae bacterium]|jgi:hypothetical protein
MRQLALLVLAVPFLAAAAPEAPRSPKAPQTIALLAAIGDRVEIVRHLKTSARPGDPYRRKTMQITDQTLNFAVLRGMDKALTEEDPEAKHVLLQWDAPPELADKITKARGDQRGDLMIGALTEHLKSLPERQQWDRIEVIVPAYTYLDKDGMGTKLSGIGVYVQPQAPQTFDLDSIGADSGGGSAVILTESDGDYRTVDPKTGATAHAATYVAPFMYFERLTFDAKSMALLKRQVYFDNTKYADPNSRALDVGSEMASKEMIDKMLASAEHSAFKSIHSVTGEVKVSTPRPLPTPAGTPASGTR